MEKFAATPLGLHIKKNINDINKINAFWLWQYHIDEWRKIGAPDPFNPNDVSIALLFKTNMGLLGGWGDKHEDFDKLPPGIEFVKINEVRGGG